MISIYTSTYVFQYISIYDFQYTSTYDFQYTSIYFTGLILFTFASAHFECQTMDLAADQGNPKNAEFETILSNYYIAVIYFLQ